MKSQEILELWEEYHNTLLKYKGRELPLPLEYEDVFYCDDISHEEYLARRSRNIEIRKENEKIEQIIYIVKNESKIEEIVFFLMDSFAFSREQIEENISFYDTLFDLTIEEITEKVKFFIDLFGSKECFLLAMQTGTPLGTLEDADILGYGKVFMGIMYYKRPKMFCDKLNALISSLFLSKENAAKILASNSRCMYCSSKTILALVKEVSELLCIDPRDLGAILLNYPSFLTTEQKLIKEIIAGLRRSFSLTNNEAISIVLTCPEIVESPFEYIENLPLDIAKKLPAIVSEKPWLYRINEGIIKHYNGYGYGSSFTTIMNRIENDIGGIVNVHFESKHPLVEEGVRHKTKILYTILLVEDKENSYYFVSLGSGYGTCNCAGSSREERLLTKIFGVKYFSEFIVKAPALNSKEYDDMLENLFFMSSTGNIIPCVCNLTDGTSIVVEDSLEERMNKMDTDTIDFCFRTIKVIKASEVSDYFATHHI